MSGQPLHQDMAGLFQLDQDLLADPEGIKPGRRVLHDKAHGIEAGLQKSVFRSRGEVFALQGRCLDLKDAPDQAVGYVLRLQGPERLV